MTRTLIRDLPASIDRSVQVHAWVKTIRDQKKVQFLILRDPTGLVQVVIERAAHPDLAALVSSLTPESAVTVTGKVVANPQVRLNGLEIAASTLVVENLAASPLPLDISAAILPGIDLRFDWRYLDLRRPESLLIFQVQTTAEMAMREFWIARSYIEVHSPKLMGTPSESGAELFEVNYFGRPAYLAQSPQFYKQMAMAAGFERAFEIAPVFRADPSFTTRHTAEFTGVDVEISWISSHQDVMAEQAEWLRYVLQAIVDKHGDAILKTYGLPVHVPALPFPQLTMARAQALIRELGYNPPPDPKGDLDPQGERLLGEYAQREFDCDFIFITDYPITARPFYHMRYPEQPQLTKSFDLLYKGVEVATGAQREHHYPVLVQQALAKGLHLEPIQFYLDFFKYGCPPHGGFGFGLARLLYLMLGLSSVREANLLFRTPNRLVP